RRIEAVTGEGAIAFVHHQRNLLQNVARLVKSDGNTLHDKIDTLLERNKLLEKENQQLKEQQVAGKSALLVSKAKNIKGIKLLVSQLAEVEPKVLRTMVDDLKNQMGSGVIVLAAVQDDKVSLIVGVTRELTEKVKAGELIGFIAQQIGGKGGGRPDMAQAGGTDVAGLPKALASVEAWIAAKV
ncbi:MAG: DHHA1 domain-containing protein, partial [Enterobacteriaceae bacterium]